MLAVTSYSPDHVAACRNRIAADVAAYEAAGPSSALDPVFYGMMVMALDRWFVHRQRSIEGKDGNALNEVRVLSDSIVGHGGMLVVEKTIKLTPADVRAGDRAGGDDPDRQGRLPPPLRGVPRRDRGALLLSAAPARAGSGARPARGTIVSR